MFSGPMFRNLGVAKRCTLLAGLTVSLYGVFVCVVLLWGEFEEEK